MICLAFCTTRSPCNSYISPISPSHNNIVDQMPVLGEGEHTGCLVPSREAEYSVGN